MISKVLKIDYLNSFQYEVFFQQRAGKLRKVEKSVTIYLSYGDPKLQSY